MKFKVYQAESEIREVEIDLTIEVSEDQLLDLIFLKGQNEIDPQPHPSVSVGDVIELAPDRLFVVKSIGFAQTTRDFLEELAALPMSDRWHYLHDREIV